MSVAGGLRWSSRVLPVSGVVTAARPDAAGARGAGSVGRALDRCGHGGVPVGDGRAAAILAAGKWGVRRSSTPGDRAVRRRVVARRGAVGRGPGPRPGRAGAPVPGEAGARRARPRPNCWPRPRRAVPPTAATSRSARRPAGGRRASHRSVPGGPPRRRRNRRHSGRGARAADRRAGTGRARPIRSAARRPTTRGRGAPGTSTRPTPGRARRGPRRAWTRRRRRHAAHGTGTCGPCRAPVRPRPAASRPSRPTW